MQGTKQKPRKPQPLNPNKRESSTVTVERRSEFSALSKWSVPDFKNIKAKYLQSPYFDVAGFDFRFLVYPRGDSVSLPGHISVYFQITNPRGTNFDCLVCYRIIVANRLKDKKSMFRESCSRFSKHKKSLGWGDFIDSRSVLDPGSGFLDEDGSLLLAVDIHVLQESMSISGRDVGDANLNGKVTWTIRNFGLFKDKLKTQKLISPAFRVGDCDLRIKFCTNVANGVEYLSLFLERELKKFDSYDKGCWCLFQISLLNQKPGLHHQRRDSHGRFGGNSKEYITTLGWTEYMKLSDFVGQGFLVDDIVEISVSYYAVKELYAVSETADSLISGRSLVGLSTKYDGSTGRMMWRIGNFVRLKDLLKKKKMTGLCIPSSSFQVGNLEFRLLMYPRGQSQNPSYLSLFLEVLDAGHDSKDWNSLVFYQLAISNAKTTGKFIVKQSLDRCSEATKEWGWAEFSTLTSIFDPASGYVTGEAITFCAEVKLLKETYTIKEINSDAHRLSVTWKVQNILANNEIMGTRTVFSKSFQVEGCELRIGVYKSSENMCALLESEQSVRSDPDRNFWVSYRITLVNIKDPSKSLLKGSSLCTRASTISFLEFMAMSDIIEAGAGFAVDGMITFVCDILDCCPWFEFPEPELWASIVDHGKSSRATYELHDSETGRLVLGKIGNILKLVLADAECYHFYEDNPQQLLVKLKEFLTDTGEVTDLVVQMRLFLDDAVKVKCLFSQNEFCSSKCSKQTDCGADQSSANVADFVRGTEVLLRTINNILLDIMIECCQTPNTCTKSSCDGSPKPSTRACQSKLHSATRPVVSTLSSMYVGLLTKAEASASGSTVVNRRANRRDRTKKTIAKQCYIPSEGRASTSTDLRYMPACEVKCPEPGEELLRRIVDSLKALDSRISQVCSAQMQSSQSAEKVFVLLGNAPHHLLPDLVILSTKLIDCSEHALAAVSLLDKLQKPDIEPSLRPPVLAVISRMNLDNEVWERMFCLASQFLGDTNDETLGVTVAFLFKAASQCHSLPIAVRVVRGTLESLGADVSPLALDFLRKIINSHPEIAEAILKEIDSDFAFDEKRLTNPDASFVEGGDTLATSDLHSVDQPLVSVHKHLSDIIILIDLLDIPSLAIEASQTFERGVAHGYIKAYTMAVVLEKLAQRASVNCISLTDCTETFHLEGVFDSVLALAEIMSLSGNSQVILFTKVFYATLFKFFPGRCYHIRMLRRLIERATNPEDNSFEFILDILTFLVRAEHGLSRLVLSMMKDAIQHANAERFTIGQQLCTIHEEITHIREEKQELTNTSKENDILLKRLADSEADILQYKSKMELELNRFAHEKKDLCGRIQALEHQLKELHSTRNAEVATLTMEKKKCQKSLRHVETQLSQLKSEKHHELKKVIKENKILEERLRNVEAERKKFETEHKRCDAEVAAHEEVKLRLWNEILQLKQKAEQVEGEKRDKEEEVARHTAYIDDLEVKLNACQQYIFSLENELKDEMSQHAPLYGLGLEELSMGELETLSRIHEEGLKQIHALQNRSSSPISNPVPGANTLQN